MKIITLNMLQCHAKGCNSFPLSLTDVELSQLECEFNDSFIKKIISRLDWDSFVQTALSLGITTLPMKLPEEFEDESFLKNVHHVALEYSIQQGNMTCQKCGHVYPIINGIPNMLLQNTEV